MKNIKQIIFITDRFGLSDSEKTNPYSIRDWRSNKWKNYENKPIKNHKLLDELDKERKKLSNETFARINIEYRPRKKNKIADKLAKAGKSTGLINHRLNKKGEKIGKRKFDGGEVKYHLFKEKESVHLNVFRKDPVQTEWEIWSEICSGKYQGDKLKLYADDLLTAKLKRGNEYIVKIKKVLSNHFRIYRGLRKIKVE